MRARHVTDCGKWSVTYWAMAARLVATTVSHVAPLVSATLSVGSAVSRLGASSASMRPSLTQAASAAVRWFCRKASNIAVASPTMFAGLP